MRYCVSEFAIQPEDPITKPIIHDADEKVLIRPFMELVRRTSTVEIILSHIAAVYPALLSKVYSASTVEELNFNNRILPISAESHLSSLEIWFSEATAVFRA